MQACERCRHFQCDPRTLESRLPGLRALSSAYAAVRAADGLCDVHARYVASHARCEQFEARLSLPEPVVPRPFTRSAPTPDPRRLD
jgi:hypothetical protein